MPRGGVRPGAGRKQKLARREEEHVLNEIWKVFGGSPERALEILHDAMMSSDGKVREKAFGVYREVVRYCIDRMYGKPTQRTELSGKDGEQIPMQLVIDI